MEMKDVFDKLKKLQDILVAQYAVETKLREEPKQIVASKELLERMKKEYIDKNEEYETVKAAVLHIRSELEAAVQSRESGEKGMDTISTHREYEALNNQIAEATEKENDTRKQLQREEKKLAELEESLSISQQMIESQENEIALRQADIDKNLAGYTQELEQLQQQAQTIKPGLEPEVVFKFERIIKRNSEGLVAVRSSAGGRYGVCTGCHMILPAQFVNEVREGEKIDFCPYCSRILFYEESTDQDDDYFNLDETGSLLDDDDDEEFDDERDDSEDDLSGEEPPDDDEEIELDDEDDPDEDPEES
ncbi:MAG: nucleic acid-binding protein [Treponema sp.]|nr:nucleic acid-binding protein [Treponema sp.]